MRRFKRKFSRRRSFKRNFKRMSGKARSLRSFKKHQRVKRLNYPTQSRGGFRL